MELLYDEATACTRGEEKAHVLLESIRSKIGDNKDNRWIAYATRLTDQAVIDFQTRAVEVDGHIEANTTNLPPFTSQAMLTLEALDVHIALLCSKSPEGKELAFQEAVKNGDAVLVELYIQAGVDPSVADNDAIRWACFFGHFFNCGPTVTGRACGPFGTGQFRNPLRVLNW